MTSSAAAGLVLAPRRVADFAGLIEGIARRSPGPTPWLAPALLFSDHAVQARLDMPRPGPGEILVHDYQSLSCLAPLPLAVPLEAAVGRADKGTTTEFDVTLGHDGTACILMKTALRRVPRTDLAALKPVRFSPDQTTGPAGGTSGLRIRQAAVGRYVTLSGDRNPIHSDAAVAAKLGLPAPIVPGLLLLALIEAFAPAGDLVSLKARFMAPLCVGTPFGLSLIRRGEDRLRACLFTEDATGLAIADLQFSATP